MMRYVRSTNIEDAYKHVKETVNSIIFAGGTDFLVSYRHRRTCPELLVDIKGINNLRGISIDKDYIVIGALTTINEIIENEIIIEKLDMLKQSASNIGCYQIRNRATIGGNICNASPAADMVPPLLCLDAVLTYYADGKYSDIEINNFFKAPGKSNLPEKSILCQIKIPLNKCCGKGIFLRHSRRNALDLSSVSVAMYKTNNNYTISLGAVAPTVIRVKEAESLLNKNNINDDIIARIVDTVTNACNPISDSRASKEYRIEMIKNYTSKALRLLMEE